MWVKEGIINGKKIDPFSVVQDSLFVLVFGFNEPR